MLKQRNRIEVNFPMKFEINKLNKIASQKILKDKSYPWHEETIF